MLTLVIGNKNHSSWSPQTWRVLRQTDIPFREAWGLPHTPESLAELRRCSPSGLVLLFQDGDLKVWDSQAICAYRHECFPEHRLWSTDGAARAYADAPLALPALREWVAAAEAETERIPRFEQYE